MIAGGGGGIPAIRRGRRLTGVDAVIDKDTAAIRFLRAGGRDAIITSPRHAAAALDGSRGTRILPDRVDTRTASAR